MAIAYGNLSLVYQPLGQWQAAEQAVTRDIDLLPTSASIDSESASVLAQILDIKGRLYLKQGQDRAALRTWAAIGHYFASTRRSSGSYAKPT